MLCESDRQQQTLHASMTDLQSTPAWPCGHDMLHAKCSPALLDAGALQPNVRCRCSRVACALWATCMTMTPTATAAATKATSYSQAAPRGTVCSFCTHHAKSCSPGRSSCCQMVSFGVHVMQWSSGEGPQEEQGESSHCNRRAHDCRLNAGRLLPHPPCCNARCTRMFPEYCAN